MTCPAVTLPVGLTTLEVAGPEYTVPFDETLITLVVLSIEGSYWLRP